MGELKKQYEVLYRTAPYWLIPLGEHEGENYPGDYAGRVTSVKLVGRGKSFGKSSARHNRGVAVLSLTKEEASLLEARKLRLDLDPSRRLPVSFEDQWGAIAPELSGMRPILEDDTLRSSEKPLDRTSAEFASDYAMVLTRELPQAEVHSGSGYYRVDSADAGQADTVDGTPVKDNGTSTVTLVGGGLTINAEAGKRCIFDTGGNEYVIISNTAGALVVNGDASGEAADDGVTVDSFETWQAAFDKLFAEQGVGAFTADQVIEGFDATYTEHVENVGMLPTYLYRCIVRAAAGETAVIITGDDTNETFYANTLEWLWVEGIEFDHTGGATFYTVYNSSQAATYASCTFKNAGGGGAYTSHGNRPGHMMDCSFLSGSLCSAPSIYERCFFDGVPPKNSNPQRGLLFRTCVLSGVAAGYWPGYMGMSTVYEQCTLYNSTLGGNTAKIIIKNSIIYRDDGGELCILRGYDLESDHNCWYSSDSDPFSLQNVEYTFAQWQALGYDEHSLNEDPLLTNPGGGDFTLQDGSPCEALVPSCGVELDVAGNPYRLTRCNVGAHAGTKTHQFGG